MAVRLDHLALAARDAHESARFLADVLDLPGMINHHHGDRGLYFDDPGGHHLEVLTARYEGSPGRD